MLKIFTPLSVSHHVCTNEWIMKYVSCVLHLVLLIHFVPPEGTPEEAGLAHRQRSVVRSFKKVHCVLGPYRELEVPCY